MAKGGARPGAGRPCGPSKATIEKSLIAARTVTDANAAGKKLAKEVLEEIMHRMAEMAARLQPALPGGPPNPYADEANFWKFTEAAIHCASKLAPFQSPTLRAIVVAAPAAIEREPLDQNKVIPMDDPVALARFYHQAVNRVVG
jgi:hypothetical protein